MGRMEMLQHAEAIERGLVDIGRAARESGVSVKMIRPCEAIGLLPKIARTLDFSTDDTRELLSLWHDKSRSGVSVKRIAGKHVEELRSKLAELESMVQTLEHLTKHCHGDHRPECPILDDLASR